VDPIVRKRLQAEFHQLQESLGKTVVFVTHDVDEAIFLGDRMAILEVGGILAQYDAPEKILAGPSSAFVERFLGGERGLKRLALLPVSDAGLIPGPFVDVTVSSEEARQVMERHGVDWVGLLDGDRLLGWVEGSRLDSSPLQQIEPRPFLVTLGSGDSLRTALDAVVTSHARVAVVVDDGVYRGMLDLEAIAGEITE
jgi:osmoprotectant transport system ATP-binding protein